MLQFINGSLAVIDAESVLPGYLSSDQDKFLANLGFECQTFGKGDFHLSIEVWRKMSSVEGFNDPVLFLIDLCGQPIEEIYCADRIATVQCLVYLAPLFPAAMLSSLIDEIENAADHRDNVAKHGATKAGSLGDVAGLFWGMSQSKGK